MERSAKQRPMFILPPGQSAAPERAATSTLPAYLTPLIGREQEVQAVCALLQRPEVRLVALTGAGGVGKTRLGVHIATEVLDDFADGVCFVSLAPISDPDLVIPTIAKTFDLIVGDAPLESLKAFLRAQQLLLLLDNFEQVIAAASHLIDLLAFCPHLTILVTSRAALRIHGEYEFTVPPLAVPNLKRLPASEALAQVAAVALFLERARAIQPDFVLTQANGRTIAEICVGLDGLPLAIELAAARVKLLPSQALLKRLSQRLEVLTGGARNLPARQQTLRNTISWSYDLLSQQEQRLFRWLSIFVGGCTLQAVEAICTTSGNVQIPVLDEVASLLDKNLLQQTEREAENPRFMMLETIREYGLACLRERGELEAAQQAHAGYYLAFVEKAEPGLRGAMQAVWLEQLEREYDNLRAAQRWFIVQNQTEMALRMGGAQWWFWMVRGHVSEGRTFLERVLSTNEPVKASVRGKALYAAGVMALNQSDYERAEAYYAESLLLHRQIGDKALIAISLYSLGRVAWAKHDYVAAHTLGEEVLGLFRELDDKWGMGYTLEGLAAVAFFQGEYTRAQVQLEESLALFKESGNKWGMAYAILRLARVLNKQGDQSTAYALLEECITLARELGYKWGLAYALLLLGQLDLSREDYTSARSHLEESVAINRELGEQRHTVKSLLQLASVATLQGDTTTARALYEESMTLASTLNHKEFMASALEGLAGEIAIQGHPAWAARLWGAAEILRDAIGASTPFTERVGYERMVAIVRSQLGEGLFTAAWAEGRGMTPEQALASQKALTAHPSSKARPFTAPLPPLAHQPSSFPAGLTAREVEVLRLVARGLTDTQIAELLVISHRTVTTHLSSIYNKLGVNSRMAAAHFATEHQLI